MEERFVFRFTSFSHSVKLPAILCVKVYAAGSEDMDTLTFNAPILYRHLTFSEAKKQPISEICLEKALEGLEMNRGQVRFLSTHCSLLFTYTVSTSS